MGSKQNERIAYTAPRWAWLAIILFLKQADRPVAHECLKLLEPVPDKPKPQIATDYPVCDQCGSKDVQADAYAIWNQTLQDWDVSLIMDKGHHCNTCDQETTLSWDR